MVRGALREFGELPVEKFTRASPLQTLNPPATLFSRWRASPSDSEADDMRS